ncbi:unnamed protein product [Amoebophrya sp. A120]|nr:unnamed protein product [Amoebophrya sp. A120]|eukprot:GSA120T00001976001.1
MSNSEEARGGIQRPRDDGGIRNQNFNDEIDEDSSAREQLLSPSGGSSERRAALRATPHGAAEVVEEDEKESLIPGEPPLTVRRQKFGCVEIFLRNATVPRLLWLLFAVLGYIIFYCMQDNTPYEDGSRPLDLYINTGEKDSDGDLIWKPNLAHNPLYKWLVMSSIILLILLMLEDMNVGLAMFLVAFKLYMFGCVPSCSAFWAGMTSSAVILYAALFVIACAFAETQVLEKAIGRLVGRPLSIVGMLRLLAPIMVLSAVLNNGPCTAIGIPIAISVADRVGVYLPSVFIMAVPFAATLGGSITTIGSSPNFAAQEFVNDRRVDSGGYWKCLAVESLIAFRGRETTREDPGNGKTVLYWDKVPEKLQPTFTALAMAEHPSYPLGLATTLVDAFQKHENAQYSNCNVMTGSELIPTTKKQKLPIRTDLPLPVEKAMKLCYQLELCIGFYLPDPSQPAPAGQIAGGPATLCKVENLSDIENIITYDRQSDQEHQLPEAKLDTATAFGMLAYSKLFRYGDDGKPVVRIKQWSKADTKNAWERLEEGLLAQGQPGEALLASIKSNCDFQVVQPVFLFTGLFAAAFGTGGLLFTMWALSKMYPKEPEAGEANMISSSYEDEDEDLQSGSEIEMSDVKKDLQGSQGDRQLLQDENINEERDVDGSRINRERSTPEEDPETQLRIGAGAEYEVELRITKDMITNEPFSQSALRFFKGVKIIGYNGHRNFSRRKTIITVDDVIRVRARADGIARLRRQMPGLVPSSKLYDLLGRSRKSRLLYQISLDEVSYDEIDDQRFFTEFDAVVLGRDPMTQMVLVEGFPELGKNTMDFQLVTPVPNSTPPRSTGTLDNLRGYTILFLFLLVVVLNVIGSLVKPLKTFKDDFNMYLWLVALIAIFIRAVTFKQALASQNGGTLMLFAFAGPVAAAMTLTGVSDLIADMILKMSGGSQAWAVALIYVMVALLTQFVDNRTLVTMLMLPVMAVGLEMRMPVIPLMTLLVNAAVANFMSPIGCSHNQFATMAANYSFTDFVKAGWGLQLLHGIAVTMFIIIWINGNDTAQEIPFWN